MIPHVENTPDPGGVIYPLKVVDEAGNMVPDTNLGLKLKGKNITHETADAPITGSGGCIEMRPGEVRKYSISVSRLYKFERSGKYYVTVVSADETGVLRAMSNSLGVSIAP